MAAPARRVVASEADLETERSAEPSAVVAAPQKPPLAPYDSSQPKEEVTVPLRNGVRVQLVH